MIEIIANGCQIFKNAPNSISYEAPPQTSLMELKRSPDPLAELGEGRGGTDYGWEDRERLGKRKEGDGKLSPVQPLVSNPKTATASY